MNFKSSIVSSVVWRSIYFATLLLLNISVSRYLQAAGSGWIYYVTNYFSFIILLASCNLETGMAFYAAGKKVGESRLAGLSVLWTVLVTIIVSVIVNVLYRDEDGLPASSSFLLLTAGYVSGQLLNTFFSALFYADGHFGPPNHLPALCNLLLAGGLPLAFYTGHEKWLHDNFLLLYFTNFFVQGLLLSVAYVFVYRKGFELALPRLQHLKGMFRYALLALLANTVFFLVYRADYWFIRNTCRSCLSGDLGNYIQVSKLGQLFLMLPVFIAGAIFPRTAAGFREQVIKLLPLLSRAVVLADLAAIALLVFAGRWLFPFVFGPSFDNMYVPFLLLSPGIICLSVIALLAAYNAGKDQVWLNVKGAFIGLIVIIAGDWIFVPHYGIYAAAVVSSAGYFAYLAYLLVMVRQSYQINAGKFFVPLLSDWKKLQQVWASRSDIKTGRP